jgi:hypothetical protein
MLKDHVWSQILLLTANTVNLITRAQVLISYFALISTNVIQCIHRYIHTYEHKNHLQDMNNPEK